MTKKNEQYEVCGAPPTSPEPWLAYILFGVMFVGYIVAALFEVSCP